MQQEKTQKELLDQFVVQGVMTSQQADDIAYAPRWSFSVRELVTYLASLIIAAGVIRLLALAFRDASVGVIAAALYVVAVVSGFASWKLSSGSSIKQRFAEVLELGSIGAACGATGIVLDQAEMKGEWIGVVLTSAAASWGLFRCRLSQFAGTVSFSVGTVGLATALGAVVDQDSQIIGGILLLVGAIVVLGVAMLDIGARQLARAIGSLFVIIGSMNIGTGDEWLRPIPIMTGVVLFALGTILLAPEMLVAGSFCVVAGVVMTTMEWVNNEMAQGLVIIATGLVVLAALTVQMRRAVSRPMPDARVA